MWPRDSRACPAAAVDQGDYLGIDPDEERLHQASALLAGMPYATRARFQEGRAECLPCSDHSVDLVLSSMTLQHVPDVAAVLSEVKRVLQAGGRFVGIEPDNLSNKFYFDGPLEEVNAAFLRLFAAQRAARRPADTAIGPAVPSILEHAGLTVVDSRPYALGRMSRLSVSDLSERARRVAAIASVHANLPGRSTLQECLATIDRTAGTSTGNRIGYGGQVILVFLTIAETPGKDGPPVRARASSPSPLGVTRLTPPEA
jgi:SAM-dependent methyltransferase